MVPDARAHQRLPVMNIGTANMQENSWANRLKMSNIKIPEMRESSRLQGWQQTNVVLSNFKPTSTAKALCHVKTTVFSLFLFFTDYHKIN